MSQTVLQCEAYGVGFRLSADSGALLERAAERLPHGTVSSGGRRLEGVPEFRLENAGITYVLTRDGEAAARQDDLDSVLNCLGRDLMVHVANFAPEFVFLHAGVVGWQGRALVLPGPSFAGKTTLVSELVRAGATYYSDEYAVIDATGWIHPYARELQMRRPGDRAQRGVPAAAFGGSCGIERLRAAELVFCQYVSAGAWCADEISPGMAVLEMLRHTIPVQRTPARVMATLTAMMAGATARRAQRGEAKEAAYQLLGLIGQCS
jgi:hypothetical protein